MENRIEAACAGFIARATELDGDFGPWPDGYTGEEQDSLRDLIGAALAAVDALEARAGLDE
jgi:hypothetical protein